MIDPETKYRSEQLVIQSMDRAVSISIVDLETKYRAEHLVIQSIGSNVSISMIDPETENRVSPITRTIKIGISLNERPCFKVPLKLEKYVVCYSMNL